MPQAFKYIKSRGYGFKSREAAESYFAKLPEGHGATLKDEGLDKDGKPHFSVMNPVDLPPLPPPDCYPGV